MSSSKRFQGCTITKKVEDHFQSSDGKDEVHVE